MAISQVAAGLEALRVKRSPNDAEAVEKAVQRLAQANATFLGLCVVDLDGLERTFEVPPSQFAAALRGDKQLDGSSIPGYVPIEHSDMGMLPDLATLHVKAPLREGEPPSGQVLCDTVYPTLLPYEACPRSLFKRALAMAAGEGYAFKTGLEPEFFLFTRDESGQPTLRPHDGAGYADAAWRDKATAVRRRISARLEELAFGLEGGLHTTVEMLHHEVAGGQHEIDCEYRDALVTADRYLVFRATVKEVAAAHGLHATFMPKPLRGVNGSGMHTHQSLWRDGRNIFYDQDDGWGLSDLAKQYVGGLLTHAPALAAITNPTVNSYKRLVPHAEAPTTIAWSFNNRSALIRIPAPREAGTRLELRMPDPACNIYLAQAAMLAAGLDGIARLDPKEVPPPALGVNIYLGDGQYPHLPRDLCAALDALERDEVILGALGPAIAEKYLARKREEWREYSTHISQWELEHYLEKY